MDTKQLATYFKESLEDSVKLSLKQLREKEKEKEKGEVSDEFITYARVAGFVEREEVLWLTTYLDLWNPQGAPPIGKLTLPLLIPP